MARIAVFGANGTIGSRIVREAVSRGHQVTAVVRDAHKVTDPDVTVAVADALDPAAVARITGQDVIVSAIGGGDGPHHQAVIAPSARSLVEGIRRQGPDGPRLIMVGGAGSLRTPNGTQVWDAPGLPKTILLIMHAHGDALDYLRTVSDVRWTNLSPAAQVAPGERTGRYRTGLDELVVGADGDSHISAEDYAVAVLDEIERPAHVGERFSVGY